jgi:hypothetical protein
MLEKEFKPGTIILKHEQKYLNVYNNAKYCTSAFTPPNPN